MPEGREQASKTKTAAAVAGSASNGGSAKPTAASGDSSKAAAGAVIKEVEVPSVISLKDFADILGVPAADIQRKLMSLGVLASLNQKLSPEVTTRLGKTFGFVVSIVNSPSAAAASAAGGVAKPAAMPVKHRVKGSGGPVPRPPVVTIMGHVDHGKTTLLDAIRNANVVGGEFGGITQHIGAYQVDVEDPENPGTTRKVTFLDTPGHAAFTAMRARGAQVTDIAVIVVAADDGVMPQTAEAIQHAKQAGVPIIIAVNKVDRPDANPDRVLTQLTEYDILVEKYGGNVQSVDISALKKTGIQELLETILLVTDAEVEPKADPKAPAQGIVIEAKLDRGRGTVATVLVEQGTLLSSDSIVAGTAYGRIRAMFNDRGKQVDRATPGTPVEILGLNSVPAAGDKLEVVKNEKEARQRAGSRERTERDERLSANTRITLEDIAKQFKEGVVKELNIILKGDVNGSVGAVREAIEAIEHPEVKANFIAVGVGSIGESDVLLASASGSIIFGFNVKADAQTLKLAEAEHVEIQDYKIIYELIDAVKKAMAALLDPIYEEAPLGKVEVRQIFVLPRSGGTICGSYVTDGKVVRGASVRAYRDGKQVGQGKIDALKRIKDDAREVAAGYECGILVPGYKPEIGDTLEVYEIKRVERTL